MSQFSTTRIADYQTAVTNNTHLPAAILWLQNNTPLSRVAPMEIYESIASAVANGTFLISYGGNSLP